MQVLVQRVATRPGNDLQGVSRDNIGRRPKLEEKGQANLVMRGIPNHTEDRER